MYVCGRGWARDTVAGRVEETKKEGSRQRFGKNQSRTPAWVKIMRGCQKSMTATVRRQVASSVMSSSR